MPDLYFVMDLRYDEGSLDSVKRYIRLCLSDNMDLSEFAVIRVRPEDTFFLDKDGKVSADNINNHGKELTWALNAGL